MSASDFRRTIIDLERRLDVEQARQDALRRVALRALSVVAARVPALEGAAHELTRAIETDPADTALLDRLGGQLADAMRSSDQRADLADTILNVVERGLHGFEFLDSEMGEFARATDHRDTIEIERTLARVFSVLHDKCQTALHEREELTEVVGEIWSRLEEVDQALSEDETRGQRARTSLSALHEGISGDVQALKGDLNASDDLQSLRARAIAGLDRVVVRVTEFREQQEGELRSALERNRHLRGKGRALESQIQVLHKRLEQARAEAARDSLTGLPNRTTFERMLEDLRAALVGGMHASLVVWDIDRFKAINDEYGHNAGDKVLKAVAEILAEGLHGSDFVARYGGEEFVMVLYGSPDDVRERAETIRQAVDRLIVRAGHTRLKVTISAGMASIDPGLPAETIFDLADQALLKAKKNGRDRIEHA
ncbi:MULTISPECIES: diguanylate cyclase [unclassified Thioalkalivibrio]|uniref:GGDEF domain-containing protein n=1 Tax=unclassified Thioalkalivibrio TaxID=2621013 RepID=UPI0003602CD3|nr:MULTISPECIES: GGDEF domain-containing protein [unclassified Thioalkalivibrio]